MFNLTRYITNPTVAWQYPVNRWNYNHEQIFANYKDEMQGDLVSKERFQE